MVIILIGLPVALIISFLISYLIEYKQEDTQQVLQFVFSKKCKNSGRHINGIIAHFKLVNTLNESELTDGGIWKQSKL